LSDPYDIDELRLQLRRYPGLVVAISGGVDSAVLLAAAAETLGESNVVAVVADSASLARAELADARQVAASLGVEMVELQTSEISDSRYVANSGDRCYWCKEQLFQNAAVIAEERGWQLAYGENASDSVGDRPGALSAEQRGVVAPLRDAGWVKSAVRTYARDVGLSIADKPAAPCLASRVAVGVPVALSDLERIEALELSFKQRGYSIVRARHLGADSMVLEFGSDELPVALAEKDLLIGMVRAAGYSECSLRAYVSGSVATSLT